MSIPFVTPQESGQLALHGVIPRRCCAFVLDFIFMTIFGAGLFFAITIFGFLTFGFGWVAFHILPWLPLVYYILFIGATGATPGQRLCGLTMRQNLDLSTPSFAQACVWSLFFWLSLMVAGLPFLLVFCNQRHRAGHDLLSGLLLVRATAFFY